MSYKDLRGALRHYNETAVESGLENAGPHRLVQMLMAGALEKIATARGHMERREFEAKGRHISWAVSIINGLRASLDTEAGGELVENLEALYDYMVRRLMLANLENDPAILTEVASLLREIKAGWDAIPDEYKNPPRGTPVERAAAGAKSASARG